MDLATWPTPLSTRQPQEDLSPWIWTFQEIGLSNESQGLAEFREANCSKSTKDGDFWQRDETVGDKCRLLTKCRWRREMRKVRSCYAPSMEPNAMDIARHQPVTQLDS